MQESDLLSLHARVAHPSARTTTTTTAVGVSGAKRKRASKKGGGAARSGTGAVTLGKAVVAAGGVGRMRIQPLSLSIVDSASSSASLQHTYAYAVAPHTSSTAIKAEAHVQRESARPSPASQQQQKRRRISIDALEEGEGEEGEKTETTATTTTTSATGSAAPPILPPMSMSAMEDIEAEAREEREASAAATPLSTTHSHTSSAAGPLLQQQQQQQHYFDDRSLPLPLPEAYIQQLAANNTRVLSRCSEEEIERYEKQQRTRVATQSQRTEAIVPAAAAAVAEDKKERQRAPLSQQTPSFASAGRDTIELVDSASSNSGSDSDDGGFLTASPSSPASSDSAIPQWKTKPSAAKAQETAASKRQQPQQRPKTQQPRKPAASTPVANSSKQPSASKKATSSSKKESTAKKATAKKAAAVNATKAPQKGIAKLTFKPVGRDGSDTLSAAATNSTGAATTKRKEEEDESSADDNDDDVTIVHATIGLKSRQSASGVSTTATTLPAAVAAAPALSRAELPAAAPVTTPPTLVTAPQAAVDLLASPLLPASLLKALRSPPLSVCDAAVPIAGRSNEVADDANKVCPLSPRTSMCAAASAADTASAVDADAADTMRPHKRARVEAASAEEEKEEAHMYKSGATDSAGLSFPPYPSLTIADLLAMQHLPSTPAASTSASAVDTTALLDFSLDKHMHSLIDAHKRGQRKQRKTSGIPASAFHWWCSQHAAEIAPAALEAKKKAMLLQQQQEEEAQMVDANEAVVLTPQEAMRSKGGMATIK